MSNAILSPRDAVRLLAAPTGTSTRRSFMLGCGMLVALSVLIDRVLASVGDATGILTFSFVVAWSAGCLSRKRLHDLGRSGFMIVLFLGGYIVLGVLSIAVENMSAANSWANSFLVTAMTAGPMLGWVVWLAGARGHSQTASTRSVPASIRP